MRGVINGDALHVLRGLSSLLADELRSDTCFTESTLLVSFL